MIPQFDHNLLSSFYLYLDNQLVVDNECIQSGLSQQFTFSNLDPSLPSDLVGYYCSDRQLSPYNSPSGVYVSGTFVPENFTYGPIIDYDKGRILFDSSSGENLTVSGNFNKKEINLYMSNEDEEWILYNKEFNVGGQSYFQTISGDGVARHTIPAIFIVNQNSEVVPYAFGGEKVDEGMIRCVIITDNNYTFEGVKNICKDLSYKVFDIFSFEDFPFGNFSSIKDAPYTYTGYCAENTGLFKTYIEEVKVYNLADVVSRKIGLPQNIKVGFADFKLCTFRGIV